MWCAYLFGLLSLSGNPLWAPVWWQQLVTWVSQNFLQLVLLSVIMVGQAVLSLAADAERARDHEILGHQVALAEHQSEMLARLDQLQDEQLTILKRLDPVDAAAT